jgi:aryl-alcohol dehydrogenase-like predicted oxidoreductase
MEQIALGNSGRQTTRLGFGCGSIMGVLGRHDSLKILESAYDAGIRHFDVAPRYGYGEAESCLGEFLQRHPGQITVTTKYGILPPKNISLVSLGRKLAGPVVQKLPGFKNRLARVAKATTRNAERPIFSAAQARASLNKSLAHLRTNHIDLWLLHDVEASDLHDDTLLRLMEDLVKEGTIGSFGIACGSASIPDLLARHPAYCRTLQYEWSVLNAAIPDHPGDSFKPFRIRHRALTNHFHDLHHALAKDHPLCQRWSQTTGADLGDKVVLARLMLKASLVMNPASIVLFSSKNPKHIQANAHTASDTTLEPPARRLHELVQSERNHLLLPVS